MTTLQNLSTSELIMLTLMYRLVEGKNPSYRDISFAFSTFLEEDPDDIIKFLAAKGLVRKIVIPEEELSLNMEADYEITQRGKSVVASKLNVSLERIIQDAVKRNLMRKIINILTDYGCKIEWNQEGKMGTKSLQSIQHTEGDVRHSVSRDDDKGTRSEDQRYSKET